MAKVGFLIVVLLALLVSVSSAAADQDKSSAALMGDYLVGMGDQLEVQVWQEPDLSRAVTVRLDGFVTIPLIGDIKAAGVTPAAIAENIRLKLATYINDPSVTVILAAGLSRQYYLVGQVASPGEYPITKSITVLQAIARGGGFQEWAKRDEVKVVRRAGKAEKVIEFDYDAIVKGKVGQNFVVEPGDTIIVP